MECSAARDALPSKKNQTKSKFFRLDEKTMSNGQREIFELFRMRGKLVGWGNLLSDLFKFDVLSQVWKSSVENQSLRIWYEKMCFFFFFFINGTDFKRLPMHFICRTRVAILSHDSIPFHLAIDTRSIFHSRRLYYLVRGILELRFIICPSEIVKSKFSLLMERVQK